MNKEQIIEELRTQFASLKEALDDIGFCTDRECMCSEAAPVVKLFAAIEEASRELSARPAVMVQSQSSRDPEDYDDFGGK